MSANTTRARPIEFRIGLGSCGIANGARPVHEALRVAIDDTGDSVLKSVGCGGMCHREPLVEVVDGNGLHAIYSHVTPADVREIDPDVVMRVESHEFPPLQAIYWRNTDLRFTSVDALQASLKVPPPSAVLASS